MTDLIDMIVISMIDLTQTLNIKLQQMRRYLCRGLLAHKAAQSTFFLSRAASFKTLRPGWQSAQIHCPPSALSKQCSSRQLRTHSRHPHPNGLTCTLPAQRAPTMFQRQVHKRACKEVLENNLNQNGFRTHKNIQRYIRHIELHLQCIFS